MSELEKKIHAIFCRVVDGHLREMSALEAKVLIAVSLHWVEDGCESFPIPDQVAQLARWFKPRDSRHLKALARMREVTG